MKLQTMEIFVSQILFNYDPAFMKILVMFVCSNLLLNDNKMFISLTCLSFSTCKMSIFDESIQPWYYDPQRCLEHREFSEEVSRKDRKLGNKAVRLPVL